MGDHIDVQSYDKMKHMFEFKTTIIVFSLTTTSNEFVYYPYV